ncbi:VOC family protein [Halopiger goleimassiliensis]|uniref:VOC family protein n=1 Tax=Halopiger goleimassiliensis TaxID=1293048 RepID=UPI000677FBE6|nr:VOC family protein [Halopiger goleimassiliensis]
MLTDTPGLHHVTGIVGDAQSAIDCYGGVLGLHLATATVNFEDVLQHHLYFGDARGTPGTVVTVFPDPHAEPGRVGAPQPTATAFVVPEGSLEYWHERLEARDVAVEGPRDRFGERVLAFEDPSGTGLELVAGPTPPEDAIEPWADGPVPLEHAIRGLHGVTLLSVTPYATASALETLGFEYERESGDRIRYRAPGDRATVVDLLDHDADYGREGPGTIHHVAVRAESEEELAEWRELFADRGYDVSRVKDRHFFHSLYVREPGGILFELATEPDDGVAVRHSDATDVSLFLPDWFEPDRDLIESQLPALRSPGGAETGARSETEGSP